MPRLLLLCSILVLPLAVWATPPSISRGVPVSGGGVKAQQATRNFWMAYHANDYEHVDETIAQLTEAFQEDPNDPIVALLLGTAHSWKFHEHGRAGQSARAVQAHAVLAWQFLQRSQDLSPRRVLAGIIDAEKATVGVLQTDAGLVEEAFQGLRSKTRQDANVHGFTQGLVFTALLGERDARYQEALDGFFAGMDGCAGLRVPRHLPYTPRLGYAWIALQSHKDPACYNNDVAPHALEGSFLGLGDAFLKQGKIKQACLVYLSIKKCPSYPSWKFQDQLEVRLKNLEALRDKFRSDSGQLDVAEPAMVFQSAWCCTVCHAR